MRRFLKKISLYLLPLLVFAVVLEIVAEFIPNSYTYKRAYMENHAGTIRTLFLGSSGAYDGFCAQVVPHSFNLANSSQTLEDDYRLLAKYIDNMDSLRCVVVGIGYPTLALTTEANRRLYYTIYMDLYSRWQPVSQYSFEVFNLELTLKKIVKYAVSRDVTRCDSLGQRIGHSAADLEQRKEFWNRDVAHSVQNDSYDVNEEYYAIGRNYNYLCDIVNICNERHICPVIVNLPALTEYTEALPQALVALQDSVLHRLAPYAVCIDASRWAGIQGMANIPLWYNATHLTREASVGFTIELFDYLEKRRLTGRIR